LGIFEALKESLKLFLLNVRKANVYKFSPVLSKAVTASRGKGLEGDRKP
jgi:hypothetical protein